MGFETRLVLNNPTGSPANVKLTARNDDGTLLSGPGIQNPATVAVAPYQQVSVQADKLFGLSPDVLTLGWIQGDSDNSQATALLFVATNAQQDGVGIAAGDALQTSLAGAIPSGLQTAMALINPNPTAANVTLQLFDAAGQQRGLTTFSIPAQGHRSQFLNDGSAAATSLIEGGHFEISSDVGLGGLEVMTGVSGYTLNPVTTPTSGPFIFPQVSSGPNNSTSLVLQNTSGVAVQVLWSAWNSQGQAFQSSDTSPVTLTIPAHGTFSGAMANIFGPTNTANFSGSVQASLVPVSGNVQPALAAGLSLYTQGTAVSSLPAQAPTSGIFLLGQDPGAAPGTTSFELLNPGTSNAQISMLYYDANGSALGNLSATLPPHQPFVMNPGAASQIPAGTTLILMRATAGVVGYQLQIDSTGAQQLLGGRAVPAQIGGAAPLSAALGGKVESSDTLASVDVPLGAMSTNTAITISSLSSAAAPPPPTGMVVVAAFQVSPPGMTFNQPVTLTFPVLNAVPLPSPALLQVYTPLSGTYQTTSTVVTSGVGGTTLTATLSSFPQGTSSTVLVVLAPQPGAGTPIPVPIGGGGGGGVVSGGGGGSGGGTTVPSGGSGGVVTSSDGQVAVVIPPGALPSATTVAVSTVSPSTLPKPTNSQGVLLAADAEPSGISFSSPVTLRFNVPSQLQGRLPSQLPLEVYNPLNGQYQSTGSQAVLSADGTTLTASVTHFTVFVILQPFTPFASPVIPTGTLVNPLGIVSVAIPAAVIPATSITSFTPNDGPFGTTVTITGTNLTGATAVTFDGIPAALFTVNSSTSITAVVPANATTGIISVTAPGGTATSASVAPTWNQLTPTGGPPAARDNHSAVLDPNANQMIVFGGNSNGGYLNDVWSLATSGSPVWTQAVGSTPSALTWTVNATFSDEGTATGTFTFDATTNTFSNWNITTSGGNTSTYPTFTFTPANSISISGLASQITFLTTSAPFPGISPEQLVLGITPSSPLTNTGGSFTILLGGGTPSPSPYSVNCYDCVPFRLITSGTVISQPRVPPTRENHTAVYDSVNSVMTIYGGYDGGYLGDVWALSNANGLSGTPTWTPLSPTGTAPTPRYSHTSVYDPSSNRMIVFGGYNGETVMNDVWVLTHANGLGGTPAWIQLSPTGTPPVARYGHSAVYVPATNEMVVFGGEGPLSSFLDDVWVLSNANGQGGTPAWTQLSPSGTPPVARWQPSATYDSVSNNMTVFGGFSSSGLYLNDTWVLSLSGTPAWTQLSPSGTFPTARDRQTAVYSSTTNQMIVFGGYNGETLMNDVWTLTGANGIPGNFDVTSATAYAPAITSVTPASGPIGTTVTITGANFDGTTSVTIGGVPSIFLISSPAQIVATVPAGAPLALVGVTVTNPAGTATLANSFTVTAPTGIPPTITSFTPASGAVGSNVTITGTNFIGVTGVTLAGMPMAIVSNTAVSITATIPATATSGVIAVTTAGGTATSSTNLNVTGTINGSSNFNLAATNTGAVLASANVTFVNTGSVGFPSVGTLIPTAGLTVLNQLSTSGTPGTGTLLPTAGLTVLNQFSTSGVPGKGTLIPTAALTVLNQFNTSGAPGTGTLLPTAGLIVANESFSPGSAAGGTDVVIKGAGFWDGSSTLPTLGPTDIVASVTIAGQAAASFAVTDDNTIVAQISPGASAAVGPIVVTFTNGLQFKPTGNFTITGPGTAGAPAVLSIFSGNLQTPTHGAISPVPFIVRVTDSNGLAVSGVPVTFTVTAGTGLLGTSPIAAAWATSLTINTDAPGLAAVYLTPGSGSNTIHATAAAITTPATINTVAGGGSPPSGVGDLGPATSASLSDPYAAVVDASGNIFIADFTHDRVRMVSAEQITVAATIYPAGTIFTIAGTGAGGSTGDSGPATSAELNNPAGVALDSSGNLYITERAGNRVRKVTNPGPAGIMNPATAIITTVAGSGSGCAQQTNTLGDGCPATSAELNNPIGVAVDTAGNIYIADYENSRIREVTVATGVITTVAGGGSPPSGNGDGGPATGATLSAVGVAVDGSSPANIYIGDWSNGRVRKVTGATGIITTFAGGGSPPSGNGDGGPATRATLGEPWSPALDAAGNLYVGDQDSQRVRKVDAFGTISTVAGNGTAGFLGDGGLPTSAELDGPLSVAVDASSPANLYIPDSANNRIRKVTPAVNTPFGGTVTFTATGQ